MADRHAFPDTDADPSGAASGRTTGPPLWVKVAGAVGVALVLFLGYMLLAGGGGQPGPEQLTPSGDGSSQTGPADAGNGAGHQPPAGGHG